MGKPLRDLTAGQLVLRVFGWSIYLLLGLLALVYIVIALTS